MDNIIAQIDAEISHLKAARALLTGTATKKAGRPAKTPPTKKKQNLSPEGRARIAAAMKARWAAAKKSK